MTLQLVQFMMIPPKTPKPLVPFNKMFKIIVIGNSAVGKTSIVNRFVGDRFDQNYKATIAADFQVKILNIQGNEIRL